MLYILEHFYINTIIWTFWLSSITFLLEFWVVYHCSVKQEHIRRRFLLFKLEDYSRISQEMKEKMLGMTKQRNNVKQNSGAALIFEDSDEDDAMDTTAVVTTSMSHPSTSSQDTGITNPNHQSSCTNDSNDTSLTERRRRIFEQRREQERTRQTTQEIMALWSRFEKEIHSLVLELKAPMRRAQRIFFAMIASGWVVGVALIVIELHWRRAFVMSSLRDFILDCMFWVCPGTFIYLPGFFLLRKATYRRFKLG